MKRTGLFLILALLLPLAAQAQQRIQVRRTTLRQTASAFGRNLGSLAFNDKIRVVKAVGGFYYIYSYRLGKRGYVYKSAVVEQNKFNSQYVMLRDSGTYSKDAITAATKGFSKTETNYGRQHRRARYDQVRRIMVFYKFNNDVSWWESFRKAGALGEFRVKEQNKYYGRRVR